MKKLLLFILLFVSFFSVKSQDLMNLQPTGFVNDYEQIFSADEKNELETILSNYAKTTTAEICVVTCDSFPAGDHIEATNLFNKWGLGSKEQKNGLLFILSKSQRQYSIVTGYGLEEFLPDGKLNEFVPNMKSNFREENYYAGVKGLIFDVQKELGNQGLEFLRKQKQIEKEKTSKYIKSVLSTLFYVFLLLLCLGGIVYIIFIQYWKNKKLLELKKEIQIILNNIEDLKRQLGDKIDDDVRRNYIVNFIDKLTNNLITEETKVRMNLLYTKLLENKQIVNSIDNAIIIISKSKSDIQKYLKDNYPYCENYLKEHLNNIITEIQKSDCWFDTLEHYQSLPGSYTKARANKLTGIQSILDSKLRTFLALTVKINNIVSDYKNLENKNAEFKKLYSEYVRKRNILSSVNIGRKYSTLVNFDVTEFNARLDNMTNYITVSLSELKNGNLNSAITNYGNFITSGIVLTSAFSATDVLFNEYNSSEKYVRDNQGKINSLITDIDFKINKSGVSYSRKTAYESVRNDIMKFKNNVSVDIILASKLLKECINDLETLLSRIKSDISSEEDSIRRAAAVAAAASYSSSSSSSSYSSSDSSFGGFSGGDSGGGGVSGGW